MRDSVYRFTLDIHDIESQVQIVAKKNDVARKINVTLMEDGIPYTLEKGCMAIFMMTKPDGNIIINNCDIIKSGSVISYEFTEQTTSAEGLCDCEIRVYDTDKTVITSPRFTMLIRENVYEDGQIESTDEFISLKEAYVGANNMDIDAEDGTITITRKDGSKKTVFESTDGYIDVPTEEEIEEVRNSIREIVDVQQSVDEDLTSIHSQITEINNDIDTANGKISDISEELISVNGSIEDINNAIEGIDGNISSINNSLEDKQDKLIAGTNIVISEDGRTISSTGGGGGSSTVSMEDVADGGVKLIVDGEYRVIAKESELPTSEDRSRWDGKMDQVTLASVATSGSYNDLSDKPSIDSELSGTSTNAIQNNVVYDAINDLNENAASLDASIKKNESDISTINGNISTINGSIETINGDISTINGDISTLNSNLNMHYNPETDMVEIFYNGQWNEWKSGQLQSFFIYKNGEIFETLDNNGNYTIVASNGTAYSRTAPVLNSDNILVKVSTSSVWQSMLGTDNEFDMSKYSTLKMEYIWNGVTKILSLDVSAITSGYIAFGLIYTGSALSMRICVCTSKAKFPNNAVATANDSSTSTTNLTTAYITKIWLA